MYPMKWMKRLASHYERMRELYPAEELIVVFDIDGTIFDLRYHTYHLLKTYDQLHDTSYFETLNLRDIETRQPDLVDFLRTLDLTEDIIRSVSEWYQAYQANTSAVSESYRPLEGVMELIRWLQLQPHTNVGINSSRPDSLRKQTLELLNRMGNAFKVHFDSELLMMNERRTSATVLDSKIMGIRQFQAKGYRVFAVIDDNIQNVHAIEEHLADSEILFMHAESAFTPKTKECITTGECVTEEECEEEQAQQKHNHVQFVWHSYLTDTTLRKFLETNIQWIEFDVRMDWIGNRVILRSDSFEKVPMQEDEKFITLTEILNQLRGRGKSIKIDFKEGGPLLDEVFDIIDAHGYKPHQLWFNAKLDVLGEEGFLRIARTYPGAIIQAPIDFIKPLVMSLPERASQILQDLEQWGINRFSVGWKFATNREFIMALKKKGYQVNIYNVPTFEAFLQASLLGPSSITSDFNYRYWSTKSRNRISLNG